MPKPFDAATKSLIETQPMDWVTFLRLPGTSATVIDADVSTVTAEADRVVRVENGATPYLLHVEFQASYDPEMGRRLLRYNVLLHYRHNVPVQSVVVLLRQKADGPLMTGTHSYQTPGGSLAFAYETVRVWQLNPDELLAGGAALSPLAPLGQVTQESLPIVVQETSRRITGEVSRKAASTLLVSTYLLLGLNYSDERIEQLFQGIIGMEESSTYQALLARGRTQGLTEGRAEGRVEGRVEEARNLLLRMGEKRLGPPGVAVRRVLAGAGLTELELLADKLLESESWDELLA